MKPSSPAESTPAFKTAPAPRPGSSARFVGRGAFIAKAGQGKAGGLTPAEVKSILEAGPAGAGTEIGTGGVWGSSGASILGYGTVQSCTLKRAATREEYDNDDGETVAYLYYNFRTEGRATLLVPATFSDLEPGDTLSVGGVSLYVDDAEKQWECRGWMKYSVSYSKHDTVAATP